ncbi:MAG: hypothetical protein KF819_02135 [Labilithrix sp.]|nr:hypothetical protein [Labilithrix sp.]
MPSRAKVLVVGLALFSVSATGCAACRRLSGNDTINLEKADVKSMSVDIRRQQKTICPREPVQMAIFADVALDGDKAPTSVETWAGREGVNKNDKLDFSDFAFQSAQGTFDAAGWFTPIPNVLATAGSELEITTVYRRRPDKFTFKTNYKPDYACIKESGHDGHPGPGGASGGTGGAGGMGGHGEPGPRFTVFATIVKTAFYDRVVALDISGDATDVLLVPEDQPFSIHAAGGDGGSGGNGGRGAQGSAGASGNPGSDGGKGGTGGAGGRGGNGGAGGTVDLVYDARFPDLRSQFKIDVHGGAPGHGGAGGAGGPGGAGGQGITPPASKPGAYVPPARSGSTGPTGASGAGGAMGEAGPPGRANVTAGDARARFSRYPELKPL